MKTNNENIAKGIKVNGWYACQDDNNYIFVDQYIDLGTQLHLHYTKEQYGKDGEISDGDKWYSDFEASSEDARFYDSIEECIKANDTVQEFRKAKRQMEKEKKDKEIIDFLKAHKDELDNSYNKFYEMAGFTYCNLISNESKAKRQALEEAVEILVRGGIKLDTKAGVRFIPLNQITMVKFNDSSTVIEMNGRENVILENKEWNLKTKALAAIFKARTSVCYSL